MLFDVVEIQMRNIVMLAPGSVVFLQTGPAAGRHRGQEKNSDCQEDRAIRNDTQTGRRADSVKCRPAKVFANCITANYFPDCGRRYDTQLPLQCIVGDQCYDTQLPLQCQRAALYEISGLRRPNNRTAKI
jgi:hypothetical protein